MEYKEIEEQNMLKLLNNIKGSNNKTTLVINAFGGAGAGKTTACLEITQQLKKNGYVAEYVQEYAKELVWDEEFNMLDGTEANQFIILKEQLKRVNRLYGKVDFVVTDSPILLNGIYNKELSPRYEEILLTLNKQYNSFNFIIKRDNLNFEQEGRIHSLEESIEKDEEIKVFLDKYKLSYETYTHSEVGNIIENSITSLSNFKYKKGEIILNKDEKSPHGEELKMENLYSGVLDVMNSSNFKTYCRTMNTLYQNKYSAGNSMQIIMQWIDRYCKTNKINFMDLSAKEKGKVLTDAINDKNAPTYLMGYEGWKSYGRQVTGNEIAYSILVPQYITEYAGKGSLLNSIQKSFDKQFKDGSETAIFRLGMTGLVFTGYKNGLIDVAIKGKVILSKQQPEVIRKFINKEVIDKTVNSYGKALVYDIKDTVQPEFLWVKNGYKKEELVLDDNGEPIIRKPYRKSNTIEFKIYNTEERRNRLNPNIAILQDVPELDEGKMNALFKILQEVSKQKGVPMTVEPINEQGTKGFFSHTDNRIVIKDTLSPTEKCSVAFHEMAHADMHYQRKDITREMKEVQAEAVAYMTAQNFGIETDTKSFNYIAIWSKDKGLKDLETSVNAILNQSKKLTNEISKELENQGLNLNLEPIKVENKEKVADVNIDDFIKKNKELLLDTGAIVESYRHSAEEMLKNASDERCKNILQEQIANTYQRTDILNKADEKLNILEERKEGEELIASINKDINKDFLLAEQFTALSSEYLNYSNELDSKEKIDFKQTFLSNTQETKKIIKEFIAKDSSSDLKTITDKDIDYISKSEWFLKENNKLIKADLKDFLLKSKEQLKNIEQVKSKNGTFIEICFCEQWSDDLIFKSGTLVHPKTANKIIESAEKITRVRKKEAEKRNDYYPYSKCKLIVFTEDDNELKATTTRVDIGDGMQKNLTDHLKQCYNLKDNSILDKYLSATRERAKEQLIEPNKDNQSKIVKENVSEDVKTEDVVTEDVKTMGINELKQEIKAKIEKQQENQHQEHAQGKEPNNRE